MRSRKGFTLIELLVVISIIAVLMTLVVTAVGGLINQSREAATQTTIRKISSMLNQRAETLHRIEMRKGYIENRLEYYAAARNISGGNVNLRKIIAKKLIDRTYFPQTRQEILDAQITSGATVQPKIVAAASANSAEILYDLLIGDTGNLFGTDMPDTDSFSASEATDRDQNGLPEFIDAWGNPLRFYRWPTRLMSDANAKSLFSTLPNQLNRDPDDPLRLCNTVPNFATTGVPAAPPWYPTGISGPVFHDAAVYHTPIVISAGPDGVLGLYEPDDTANNGHLGAIKDLDALYDDITYLSVRAGGK